MTNADKKVAQFGAAYSENSPKEVQRLDQRDGLFESHTLITRKLVTKDGRQLLREQTNEEK